MNNTTTATAIGSKDALFLGCCKGCKGRARVHAPVERQWTAHLGYGRTERRYERKLPNGERVQGFGRFFARCLCGRHVEFKMLVGQVNEKKVCMPRCMASTGPSCSCSCGGHNHGASFSGAAHA